MRKGQLKLNVSDTNKRSEFRGLYQSWKDMLTRTNNPNHKNYKYWGGRGISVCEGWKIYENFKKWALENGWEKGLTIDRIDCDKNYEPANCRWLDRKEQSLNLRNTNLYECNGILFSQRKIIEFLWTIKVGETVCIKKLKTNTQRVGQPYHKNHTNRLRQS